MNLETHSGLIPQQRKGWEQMNETPILFPDCDYADDEEEMCVE